MAAPGTEAKGSYEDKKVVRFCLGVAFVKLVQLSMPCKGNLPSSIHLAWFHQVVMMNAYTRNGLG